MQLIRSAIAAALMLVMLAPAARAADAVTIEKAKVTVEYKTFDPKHLPDPPPPVDKGEAAATVYGYGVETNLQYTYPDALPPRVEAGAVKMEFKMERVTLKLSLSVTVWLPEGANDQLKAHEEGHRQLAEMFYADADKAARKIAAKMAGKTVTGEGSSVTAAGKAAVERANKLLCDEFLQVVADPCQRAQTAFDRITDHGRKEKPGAKEAVELAAKEGAKK
jgi:predicted secreted Zn-dependent protease